jgi:beta-N-acetylhexosaminidase
MPIGSIMLDVAGFELSSEDKELLQNPLVGGVILFSRNYHDLQQLRQLVYEIRNCRKDPVLIAVDQEGGRVQRFQEGFTTLPPNRIFGELFDEDQPKAINMAMEIGWLMAVEILAVGIDLSFGPVLDIDTGLSEIIRGRGFHADPCKVSDLAISYITGMHEAGMAATGKHFPGHGSVIEDSHITIPKDKRPMEQIGKLDLLPFTNLAQSLNAIMPAHIIYSEVDELPACFSKIWLQDILRHDIYFNGAIFSDDLGMKGAEVMGGFVARAKAALVAGCDMILVCNNRGAAVEIVEALAGYRDARSEQRLLKLCGHFYMTREELTRNREWQHAVRLAEELNERSNY